MQDTSAIDEREEGVVAVSGVHRSRADREERLFVVLSPVADWGRRVRVLLAVGVLAVSVGATGTSVASEPDDQREGVVVPESDSPSPNDVDHGASPETALPYEVDPVLADPQGDAPQGGPGASPGGGSADESDDYGPIEAEPVDDPDAGLQLTDPAVPGGLDSGALPVSPTAPAPPTGTPAGPDSRDAAPEGAPLAANPESAIQATWHATGSELRSGKLRSPAEAPPGESEPVAPAPTVAMTESEATETPAGATEPVAAAVSLAAPLGRGRFHVVRPGESLWSIASRLLDPGASDGAVALAVRRLWRLNAERIATGDPNLLRVGVKLRLR